ncbi:hypothetical protein HELRODRAFT_185730 [Helobdella robusta]|uniref:Tetraspanin n=1 Tax=Helobdella robusta TaxID=6412 RepID=T1FN76_HELRO|nr:hypothetical protein HELRODRAFT_185730 [Helobdella robusta]ESO01092.1 hypothetical protein HELRODRAFT_185730 [Helobdella robusta]
MSNRAKSTFQSSAATNFLKILLTIFNFVFLASGVAILGLGLWMHFELYRYMQLTTVYYDAAPYILVSIGMAIILIGCLGCMCTIKGHGRWLYLFTAFLIMIFILEVSTAISAFVYRDTIKRGFSEGMLLAMEEYMEDPEKQAAIDGIQSKLRCCGYNSHEDWSNYTITHGHIPVPKSCCKVKKCDTTDPEAIYVKGCFERVSAFMRSNFSMIGGIAAGFGLVQLLGAVISCCLSRNINKHRYEQME